MESLWSGNLYLFKFCISSQICFCLFLKENNYHKGAIPLFLCLGASALGLVSPGKDCHRERRYPWLSWYLLELRGEWRNLIINIAGEMVKLQASKQAQGNKEEHPAKLWVTHKLVWVVPADQ